MCVNDLSPIPPPSVTHNWYSPSEGITLDTLTFGSYEYGAVGDGGKLEVKSFYESALNNRKLESEHSIKIIDPKEIILKKVIGEGNFGRVWGGKWRVTNVAVKEFVFAQAAISGKSTMKTDIVEEVSASPHVEQP